MVTPAQLPAVWGQQNSQLTQSESDKGMETINRFMVAMQITDALQYATLIPEHLRGVRKKVGSSREFVPYSQEQIRANVLMVVNRALQWEVDPIALLPESFVVGGKLDFQGKVIIAVVNRLGRIKGNLRFEFSGEGDSLTVTVLGELRSEPGEVRTCELSYAQAVTRDSSGKINEQWTKDPKQKLIYSGAKKWARQHTPEVVLGLFGESEELPEPTVIYSPRQSNDLIEGDTLDGDAPIVAAYIKRISSANDRDSLSRIVDRIKSEVPAAMKPKDQSRLVDLAKDKWRMLAPAEPEAVSDVPLPQESEMLLAYEAGIREVESSDALQALADRISADESLSIKERRVLSQMVNDRGREGF